MIKVINLISLIFAPLILALADQPMISYGIGVILVAVVAVVIWFGKREGAFTKIQTQSASSSSKNSTES
jgi:hypothetical protein